MDTSEERYLIKISANVARKLPNPVAGLCGKAIGVRMPMQPCPSAFSPCSDISSSRKGVRSDFLDFIEEVWKLYAAGEDYDPSVFDIPHTQLKFLPGIYEDPSVIPLMLYFLQTPDIYRVFVYTEGEDEKKIISHIVLRHVETYEEELFVGEECARFLGNFFQEE